MKNNTYNIIMLSGLSVTGDIHSVPHDITDPNFSLRYQVEGRGRRVPSCISQSIAPLHYKLI